MVLFDSYDPVLYTVQTELGDPKVNPSNGEHDLVLELNACVYLD